MAWRPKTPRVVGGGRSLGRTRLCRISLLNRENTVNFFDFGTISPNYTGVKPWNSWVVCEFPYFREQGNGNAYQGKAKTALPH
jgi:hypothetical protein